VVKKFWVCVGGGGGGGGKDAVLSEEGCVHIYMYDI